MRDVSLCGGRGRKRSEEGRKSAGNAPAGWRDVGSVFSYVHTLWPDAALVKTQAKDIELWREATPNASSMKSA